MMSHRFILGAVLTFTVGLAGPARAQPLSVLAHSDANEVLERPARLDITHSTLEVALGRLAQTSGVGIAFSPSLIRALDTGRVDCQCARVTVGHALDRLLAGVPAAYRVVDDQVIVAPAPQSIPARLPAQVDQALTASWAVMPEQEGIITGRVTAAESGEPLVGITVSLDGTAFGTLTDTNGRYRLGPVPAGSYTLVARGIGHEQASRVVTVSTAASLEVDFALRIKALAMEEIIVAGTMVQTRLRESPVPVAVLSADQIQIPSRNTLDQLFRGDIPGTIGMNNGAATTGGSYMFVRGSASLDVDNLVKVYVDGVELPSTTLISTIDMQNVERIELLRGPQASTVYGSNASGGVLLIFTKRGTAGGPRITGSTAAGVISSDFVDETPVVMEHRLNVSGGDRDFTYSIGGSYVSNGEVLHQAHARAGSVNGRTTFAQGPFTLSTSLAYTQREVGVANPPLLVGAIPGFEQPANKDVTTSHQLVGATLGYAPNDAWSTTLTVGNTNIGYTVDQWAPQRSTPDDTLRNAYIEQFEQLSARLSSTLRTQLSPSVVSTATAGVDLSRNGMSWFDSYAVDPASGSSSIGGSVAANRITYNRGYFLQEVLGIKDRLFLTGAVRAESNSNFGEDGIVWAPRVGAAYVVEPIAGMVLKPRASYGRSIRPPQPGQAEGGVSDFFVQLPNAELRPEVQNGYDVGFDLDLLAGRVSLEATYFNQTAENLIDLYRDYSTVPFTAQYQNMAEVANEGVELAFRSSFGAFRLRAAYTYASSEVRALADGYGGDLEVGDRLLFVPSHTAGVTGTLALPAAFGAIARPAGIEVGLSYVGKRTSQDLIGLYGCIIDGVPEGCTPTFRSFWNELPAFTDVRASVWHPIGNSLDFFLNVENLADRQTGELYNYAPSRGRTVLIGVRMGS